MSYHLGKMVNDVLYSIYIFLPTRIFWVKILKQELNTQELELELLCFSHKICLCMVFIEFLLELLNSIFNILIKFIQTC